MKKLFFFIIILFIMPVSVFGHVDVGSFRKLFSNLFDDLGKSSPGNTDEFLEKTGIDIKSVPEEILNNIKEAVDNPVRLMTEHNLSLKEILESDVYKTFFFENLDLSNVQQMEELFSHLIPGIKFLGDDVDSGIGFYRKVFSSEQWDEFIAALEEYDFAVSSGFGKTDIEATLLTHLGHSSYYSFVFRNDLYVSYNSIEPHSPWLLNGRVPPTEVFLRRAIRSGTNPSDILINPHFKLDPNHPTFQNLVKVILSDSGKINENINSREVVLKMWYFFRTSSLPEAETGQNTFRRYIIKHFKRGRGDSEGMESIVAAIRKSPFLKAVFQAADEDVSLAGMVDNILLFNLKPVGVSQTRISFQVPFGGESRPLTDIINY